MSELDQLEQTILADISAAADEQAIEAVRVAALGKKGSVSEKLKLLGTMTPEERQTQGPAINGLKNRVTEALSARKTELRDAAITARRASSGSRRRTGPTTKPMKRSMPVHNPPPHITWTKFRTQLLPTRSLSPSPPERPSARTHRRGP